MIEIYEGLAEALEYRIKEEEDWHRTRLERAPTLRMLAGLLPADLPAPESVKVGSSLWPLYIVYPANFLLADGIVAKLVAAGFTVGPRVADYDGFSHKVMYPDLAKDTTMYVSLDFETGRTGATCVVNKIGEKKVEHIEAVYEVICPEGAAEGW